MSRVTKAFFFALFCFFFLLHGKLSLHFRGMLSWNLNLTKSFMIRKVINTIEQSLVLDDQKNKKKKNNFNAKCFCILTRFFHNYHNYQFRASFEL